VAFILIIDDSKFTRNQLIKGLAGEGYKIMEATNGKEGLDIIKSQKPECVVSDLLMPVMDGQTLLKHLKEDGIKIPVIVVTADIQEDTKEQCLQLGALEVLNKPPKEGQLKNAIQKALKTREA
jgi:CheY-like chemotaxis protein